MTIEYLLSKTLYGADIIQYILSMENPDNIMTVIGDDCGTYPDPVPGRGNIHIILETTRVEGHRLPERLAIVVSEDGTRRDALQFAADYFSAWGKDYSEEQLVSYLSEALYIKEPKEWKLAEAQPQMQSKYEIVELAPVLQPAPKFSFYKRPVKNTKPCREASPEDIYKYLISDYAKERTETLRAMADVKERRKYKAKNFDYITPAGIFASRKEGDLIEASGYMVIDFDHVPDPAALIKKIADDWDNWETVLAFRSPSGDGVKWIVNLPPAHKPDGTPFTYGEYFSILSAYSKKTYGVEADKSGKDICRACFLPYDPNAYIFPFFIESQTEYVR